MRSILLLVIGVFIAIILIPAILVQSCNPLEILDKKKEQPVLDKRMVRVYVQETGEVISLDLEEYIKGVVAGEMPAAFHMEALKAQAVAARSYAISRIEAYREEGNPGHPNAELCDQVHCQVWLSPEKLKELKSDQWMKDYWPRIEQAVEETVGLVMTYEGKPLEQPLFHSTSGGRTENSEDVFAASVPYLRSVESPYEKEAPHFTDQQIVSVSDFVAKIKEKYSDCNIQASNLSNQLKILERSEGGRVLKMQVGNKILSGRELRELFGLRSANFQVSMEDKNLIFHTIGYGHGVGMSQWGANGMAKEGHTFEEILKHYYQGVTIEKME